MPLTFPPNFFDGIEERGFVVGAVFEHADFRRKIPIKQSSSFQHLTTECPQIPVHIILPLRPSRCFWNLNISSITYPNSHQGNAENPHLNDSPAWKILGEELSVGRILNISGQVEILGSVIQWDPFGGKSNIAKLWQFWGIFILVVPCWVGNTMTSVWVPEELWEMFLVGIFGFVSQNVEVLQGGFRIQLYIGL